MRRPYLIALFLSIALNVAFIARRVVFEAGSYTYTKPSRAHTIILGDSRADQGNWAEGLQSNGIANLAKGGSTIRNTLAATDSFLKYCPARLAIIESGINDLRQPNGCPDSVAANMLTLCRMLLANDCEPIVLSVIPVFDDIWQETVPDSVINARVSDVNATLRAMCYRLGIAYVDLSALSERGRLRRDVTTDGVHLNDQGYQIIFNEVKRNL